MAEETSQKVVRRSQAGIPARSSVRRSIPLAASVAAVLGVAAAVAGFVARPAAESAFVLWYARNATGLRVDASRVEPIDGGYALIGVSASTPGGAFSLSAAQADVTVRDHDARIVLEGPHLAFAPDRYRGSELGDLRLALERSGFGSGSLALSVRGGTAALIAGDVPVPTLAFAQIAGWSILSPARIRYDASANLIDEDHTYPLAAHSAAAADGSLTNVANAARLPLEPFASLLPASDDLRVLGGTLSNVTLEDGAELSATAQLEGGDVMLGTHMVANLEGPIVFAGNGAGSPGLTGTIDGVPLSISGEMHDLGPNFGFLQSGSNDVTNLAQLVEKMAGEPRVSSIVAEAEAPGLAFGQYAMTTDHGPLAVSILAADPREPTLRFDTGLAGDSIISGGERTSALGLRTGAVGGVNGDYFDIGRTYQPQGMLVRSGELLRGPVDRAALAIDRDKHVTFGEFTLAGSLVAGGKTYPVTQVNDWPAGNVTIITPAFGKQLPAAAGTTFARLEPAGTDGSHYRITAVEPVDATLPVSFGIALGPKVDARLHVGETVSLSYRTEPSLANAVAAIGGGPILVRDGEAYEDPHAPAPDERNYRWPVIALAETNQAHLLLVAVDGRHPERSVGMMRPEFAELLLRLGTRNAMALDSGGSVTLVSRKVGDATVSVRNVPSDNSAERWVSDALFLYSSAPLPTIVPPGVAPTPVPEVRPSP
jgi:hypothetical protein